LGLAIVSANEVAVLGETVVEDGVDEAGFLLCLYLPETERRPLSSSAWRV
jgi:hypothetical protein